MITTTKKHRSLSKIKASMINLWTRPDNPDFASIRDRLQREFDEAEKAGTPWEVERESLKKSN